MAPGPGQAPVREGALDRGAVRDILQSCEQLVSQQAAGSADVINYPGICAITSTGVDAATLAAPIAGDPHNGGDDGKSVLLVDTGGHAHTVTAPTNAIVPSHHLLTFNGTKGSFVQLIAFNGLWYVLAVSGVTPS